MKVLIKQACITDPSSPQHGSTQDVLIDSGLIADIQPLLDIAADQIIDQPGICVSPGWMDSFANFADPGYEFKETLETGASAAASGGYTDVMVIPNTQPVIDSKSLVEYILHKSAPGPVNIHPMGAITRKTEGRELAEMYDMRQAGALAFSDGLHPVQSSGLLVKALLYVKAFGGILIQLPDDETVGANGLMHEGLVSTRLGLPGKPMMAEELQVARDIKLARYAESRLHFTGVSSPKSLEYIRRAKDSGLDITCSVTPYHLFFSDEDLLDYNTNLKVFPPLRTKSVVAELRKAVADGTIDCIASHHLPHEKDSKVVEFEHARYGMSSLEIVYPALKTALPEVAESRWVELLSINPRRIFGLPPLSLEKNAPAIVTLFHPGRQTEVNESFFRSKSPYSGFLGRQLQGQVTGIINREKVFIK